MMLNRKVMCVAVAALSSAVAMTTIVATGVIDFGAFALMRNVSQPEYTLVFDESNAPTASSSTFEEVTHSIRSAGGGIDLQFNYSNVKSKAGSHAVLKEGSSIVRTETTLNNQVKGMKAITATFSGGKLFVKYGLEGALHYEQLTSGSKFEFADGYQFNVFEIYTQDADVDLVSMSLEYDCDDSQATNPTVSQPTGANFDIGDGAVVSGLSSLRTSYAYGEEQIFHVKAKGNGTISHVKVNGYELPVDTRFDAYGENGGVGHNAGYYSFNPGPNDKIEIATSVDNIVPVTVNLKVVDPDDGSIDDVPGYATYICPIDTDNSNEWYLRVNAPDATDIDLNSDFVPNQDYICFEKGTTPSLTFYYSQLADTYSGTPSLSLSGSGLENDPYLIRSIEDWMCFDSNASTAGSANKYYMLTKSLDFDCINSDYNNIMYGQWAGVKPAVSSNNTTYNFAHASNIVFSGHFDGNNCSIREFKINSTEHAVDYTKALFAAVNENATVENLSIYGSIYRLDAAVNNACDAANRAGGIAGILAGTINHVNTYVDVKVSCTRTSDGNSYTGGGIVGELYTNGSTGSRLLNSTNYGHISSEGSNGKSATNYCMPIGGIAGDATGGAKGYSIVNCQNFGEVSTNCIRTGGILGFSCCVGESVTITDCNNYGPVSSTYGTSGGIVGRLFAGNVTDCCNFGNVTVSLVHALGVGGILGETAGNNTTYLDRVSNFAQVRVLEANVNNQQLVTGGIIGKSTYTIELYDAFNFGKVSFEGTSFLEREDSSIRKVAYLGGMIGWVQGNASTRIIGSASKPCVNFGDLSTTSQEIGGCYGYISNTTDLVLSISYFANIGNVSGILCGGIGGNNTTSPTLNVTYSCNAGKIMGSGAKQLASYMDVNENNHEYGLLG